jgi:hypothetical protein
MISPNVFAKTNDTLPAFTDLGGYPLVYFCEDAEPVCPTCVNNIKEFSTEDVSLFQCGRLYWEHS